MEENKDYSNTELFEIELKAVFLKYSYLGIDTVQFEKVLLDILKSINNERINLSNENKKL